jgi:hypothetical protein
MNSHADRNRSTASTPLPALVTPLPFVGAQVAVVGGLLLAVPRSTTGQSVLQVVQLAHGTAERYPLRETAAPALVAGPDGRAYLGTASGRLLRFDPAGKLATLAHPLTGEPFTRALCTTNGRLYFGSAPAGAVLRLDPRHPRRATVHRPPGDGARAVTALVERPDGTVDAFLDGATPSIFSLAPDNTTTFRPLPITVRYAAWLDGGTLVSADEGVFVITDDVRPAPGLPDGEPIFDLHRVGDSVLASGAHTGTLYRRQETGWTRLGTPMPQDPLLFTTLPDGRLAGITYQGRMVESTADWRMYRLAKVAPVAADGQRISALALGPDRCLYLATEGNMSAACWNPFTEAWGPAFPAAPHPGAVTAIGAVGERLYLGFAGGIMRYYPELDYRMLENPVWLPWSHGAPTHPVMRHHGPHLYLVTADALVRVNAMDACIDAFPDLLPGQALTSLAVDRLHDVLVIGGQVRDGVPRAAVAVWSPARERVVEVVVPFPQAAAVQVWAAENGRVFITDGGARLAIFTPGDGITVSEFPLGAITAFLATLRGELYGLAGGWFFRYDPDADRITRLCRAEGIQLTEIRPGLFAFANGGRVYQVAV